MGNHYGRSFFRKWIFAYSRIKKAEKINLLPSKRLYFFHSFWKTMYVYWSFHLLCPITMSLSVFELKPKSKKFYFGKLPTAWKKTRTDQTTWQAHLLRILAWTLNSNQMWAVTNPLKANGETSKSAKGVSNWRYFAYFAYLHIGCHSINFRGGLAMPVLSLVQSLQSPSGRQCACLHSFAKWFRLW